jgi:hypothetical protein
MKEEKMKGNPRKCLAVVWTLTFLFTTVLTAQNLLIGGNMEDESAWNIHYLDSEDFPDYEFNFDGDVASFSARAAVSMCIVKWFTART